MMLAPVRALAVLLFLGAGSALAQDAGTQNRTASTVDTTPPGTLEKVTLPPLANPDAPNIPAKELLQTAEVLRTVRGAAEFGVHASAPTIELGETQVRKQAVVDRLVGGLETLLKGRKVTIVGDHFVTGAKARFGDGVNASAASATSSVACGPTATAPSN